MLLILLGLLPGQLVGHHLVSVCVFEKVKHVPLYEMYNMTFSCSTGATYKNSVSCLFFSMSYCIYVTLTPCSIIHYYMVLICVQVMYMCAIVMKIHILSFCCFCIQTYIVYLLYFWCCHDSVYLLYLLFFVHDFVMCRHLGHLLLCYLVQCLEQPSPMQTVVCCFLNLGGLCQMLHILH